HKGGRPGPTPTLANRTEPPAGRPARPPDPRHGDPDVARILLIDDDPDLTRYLRGALEQLGHAVECLGRAQQGPDLLARSPSDLVLLDNVMPGMTGVEFLEALRDRGTKATV